MASGTAFAARGGRHFYKSGPRNQGRNDSASKPSPTHFLCLPIGHHVRLQEAVSSFTDGLLQCTPALPGLDRSIVIAPRRLHLTLGVMTLDDSASANSSNESAPTTSKTLQDALSLLLSLKPRIMELLSGSRLCVPLHRMNIMEPDGGDPDNAHVLWLGPSHDGEDARRLQRIGDIVSTTFREAGFISERRPLKLHCTVLNTIYRKPRPRGPRQPFSYRALVMSAAARPFFPAPAHFRDAIEVDFGTWDVEEIQLCKMGSYGRDGEYVSCGGFSLLS
ncbi:kinase A anchor protein [Pisolithus tinctorius]|nr:kinase A anchor protein [Pisolithus tinctorius]